MPSLSVDLTETIRDALTLGQTLVDKYIQGEKITFLMDDYYIFLGTITDIDSQFEEGIDDDEFPQEISQFLDDQRVYLDDIQIMVEEEEDNQTIPLEEPIQILID